MRSGAGASVGQPQEDVAYAFNKYHLISAPVVDSDGRLAGVITIDDAMNVLEDETEEDLRLLAGVGDETLTDGVIEIYSATQPMGTSLSTTFTFCEPNIQSSPATPDRLPLLTLPKYLMLLELLAKKCI